MKYVSEDPVCAPAPPTCLLTNRSVGRSSSDPNVSMCEVRARNGLLNVDTLAVHVSKQLRVVGFRPGAQRRAARRPEYKDVPGTHAEPSSLARAVCERTEQAARLAERCSLQTTVWGKAAGALCTHRHK